MAEFHKNQVAWQAPEAQKVTLAKPDNTYLANALNNLAQDSQYIADAERKRLDDALVNDLNEQINLANRDIDDARSADADFDSLGEKALSRIQATLSQYDRATQRRFLEVNPHYIDNTQLAISEKILKRQRDIQETDVENSLPLWTSQAVKAGTPAARQEVVKKIRERLGNISYETTVDNLIFKANQMMDNASIANLISRGTDESLAQARAFLNTPEANVTIDAYRRANWIDMVNDAQARLDKAKKSTDDPESNMLIDVYAQLKRTGQTAVADALYHQIVNTDDKIIKLNPAGWALTADGKAIPAYIDISKMSGLQRANLGLEFNKYKNLDPNQELYNAEYAVTVNNALTDYQVAAQNKTSEQADAVSQIHDLMSNQELFNTLAPATQERLVEVARNYNMAGAEALAGHKMFTTTPPFAARSIGTPVENLSLMIARGESPNVIHAANIANAVLEMKDQPNPFFQTRKDMLMGMAGLEDRYDNSTHQIVNAADEMHKNFFSDLDYNSLGKYGVNAAVVLEAYRRAGKLNGTRLYGDEGQYFRALSKWESDMRGKGIVHSDISSNNEGEIESFFKYVVGDDTLTPEENKIAQEIKPWARSAQARQDAGALERAISTPTPVTIYTPGKSNPTPYLQQMKISNTLWSKDKQIKKAAKEAKKD